ncbi:MAG: hypothetical protein U1D66_07560 [Erythrobacter sp.]|nr:hypothetical protein [Erythrobacter sp.]
MNENPDDPSLTSALRDPARAALKAPVATPREQRLKAALKANMARRKAQARARAGHGTDDDAPDTGAGNKKV